MIRCEQCFYRYPAGTLFCDVCGAALSPWLLERDADREEVFLPADDLEFTFEEPSLAPPPFSPFAPNSGRLVSDSDLLGVSDSPFSDSPSSRLFAPTPEVSDEAHSDARQQRQQQERPQPNHDERRHERTRGSGADEIVVGMEAAPKCVWVILTGGQTFELAGKAQYLIGRRDPANNVMPDIDLTNWYGAANGVSRVHASLYITPIGVFVEDLESRNETMRNEDRLLPRQRYALRDGDVLRLGQMVLHVQFAEEP